MSRPLPQPGQRIKRSPTRTGESGGASGTVVKPSWRECWKVHPAADSFPLMAADELRKLADDIDANGLKIPIQTRSTPGSDGGTKYLIDGRNRCDAMELLDWQIIDDKGEWMGALANVPGAVASVEHKTGRTHEQIVAEVIALNIRRRHLTKQEQVELIDKALRGSRHVGEVPGKVVVTVSQSRWAKGVPGSAKDDHKAAVVTQAATHGISNRTVERALSKQDQETKAKAQPTRKRRAKRQPPPYEPTPNEQAKLDAMENKAKALAETIDTGGLLKVAAKLDAKEKQRWLDAIKPLPTFCRLLDKVTSC